MQSAAPLLECPGFATATCKGMLVDEFTFPLTSW